MERKITKDHLVSKYRELAKLNKPVTEYFDLCQQYKEQERKYESFLSDHPYNGIRGIPPDWVPPPIVSAFLTARQSIFNNTSDIVNKSHAPYDLKLVLDTLSERRGQFKHPDMWIYPSHVVDDDNFVRDMKFLIWLWNTIKLGKKKALKKMHGQQAYDAMEILEKKTAPLKEANHNRQEFVQNRNQAIKKIIQSKDIQSIGKNKSQIARHLLKHHPDLMRKEDGQPLSINAITRII